MDTLTPLWTDYDQEEDILYVRPGGAPLRSPDVRYVRTDEADHGVLIDRDPSAGEVMGIEILDFLGHFAVIKDLSWLSPLGVPSEIVPFLRQKANELQQQVVSRDPLL